MKGGGFDTRGNDPAVSMYGRALEVPVGAGPAPAALFRPGDEN
ncbi:MAG TPA: hypothetical protein VF591_13850 [Pyrinomonadaceae bacterium]|jgi:hypothetical protein